MEAAAKEKVPAEAQPEELLTMEAEEILEEREVKRKRDEGCSRNTKRRKLEKLAGWGETSIQLEDASIHQEEPSIRQEEILSLETQTRVQGKIMRN
jgi:hypothetical protein